MEFSQSTESEFPLDRLPVLVIGAIAKYLDISDLAACCSVSRGVREAFDVDVVWKPRYDEKRVKYLLQTPCKVQPGFVHPETNESGLRPMSEWRVAFIAENHLLNNWRQRKYTVEIIKSKIKMFGDAILLDDFLMDYQYWFLPCDYVLEISQDKVEILDIRDSPATRTFEPIPCDLNITYVVNANDMIILLYIRGVEVYQLDFCTKQWNVKYAFFLDEPELLPFDEREAVKESSKDIDLENKFFCNDRFLFTKHYFVGCLTGSATIHIWNFETGIKLRKEDCPIKNSTIQEIKASNTNLIICVKQKSNNTFLFLAYDLSKLIFLKFYEKIEKLKDFDVFGNYVSIRDNCKMNIYNYQKNKIISNYALRPKKSQIIGEDIVFIHEDTLKIFDHSSGTVKILMNHVLWFEVLSDKFIQIQLIVDGDCFCSSIFEVLPLNRLRKTSLSLGFKCNRMNLNVTATKYIVNDMNSTDVHIMNFW